MIPEGTCLRKVDTRRHPGRIGGLCAIRQVREQTAHDGWGGEHPSGQGLGVMAVTEHQQRAGIVVQRTDCVATLLDVTSGVQGVIELIEPVLPEGARELAAVDLNTWLQVDLPAMSAWVADPATVKEITTPIAWIGGADSPPGFTDSRALLQEWRPTTKAADIVGAGHYFPVLKPAETATTLDELLRSQAPAQQA